ncbi:F-box/kelch-repeat protein At3g23880-like [Spinacia oleracea]|uniref:F-box/kelch-repeat protein At3g23880-like n=1 Tax=Spinacia oleracea TaxID=3562 RepID=A0ABM3QIH4_SPIOL|nr:F-box/kelch-repeat protein At3g23880-like [Spinacia oleracea]
MIESSDDHGRLPLELVSNILVRLPAEDLMDYCKFVCKRWRDEINTPKFIESHNRRIFNNGNNIIKSIVLYSTYKETLMCIDFHSNGHIKINPIIHNVNSVDMTPVLVGSCTGLLCFACYDRNTNMAKSFSVYNPITGASKLVPWLEQHGLNPNFRNGFGYDCTSGDYKILCFALDETETPRTICTCVYSFNTDSWKVNKEPCPLPFGLSQGGIVFSNNALHFITLSSDIIKIIGFDLGTEKFHEIPLPVSHTSMIYCAQQIELANLRGCLHLVTTTTEVWVMKEYGVKESWTQLFHYDILSSTITDYKAMLRWGNEKIMPCAYSEDGSEILVVIGTYSINRFFCLDVHTLQLRKLEISTSHEWDWSRWEGVMPWVGSFVCPSTMYKGSSPYIEQ